MEGGEERILVEIENVAFDIKDKGRKSESFRDSDEDFNFGRGCTFDRINNRENAIVSLTRIRDIALVRDTT